MEILETENRPTTTVFIDDTYHTLPIYSAGDTIRGKVYLTIPKGKTIEHRGVRLDLVGFIESGADKGEKQAFITHPQDKEGPGELSESKVYDWSFTVPKNDETYYGDAVQLRFQIRAKIRRAYGAGVETAKDFAVQNIQPAPEVNDRIKIEVGIEQCLHIEFEYQRTKYALSDVLIGTSSVSKLRLNIWNWILFVMNNAGPGRQVIMKMKT